MVPGKFYYSNSKGEYIEGEYVGMRGMDSYYVYIDNEEVKMMTDTRNRIGYAIGSHQLMVETKPLRWLCLFATALFILTWIVTFSGP